MPRRADANGRRERGVIPVHLTNRGGPRATDPGFAYHWDIVAAPRIMSSSRCEEGFGYQWRGKLGRHHAD